MAPTLHLPDLRSSTPPIVATSNDGVLPLDLIHDILLRLPAEPICRFRAVCRSWRSMLCHPDFIAAARAPGTLLAAAVCENFSKVLDTESGVEIKQVNFAAADDGRSYCCSLDSKSHERAVCVIGKDRRTISLLDPATGAISVLPDGATLEGASTLCTIGRTASTGEHKVIAIATTGTNSSEACKILTLSCGDYGWRETGRPPMKVVRSCIGFPVVNGVAYTLGYLKSGYQFSHMIMEFDLDCEAWRPATIPSPANLFGLSLSELQGHLVAACDTGSTVVIWFLVDSEKPIIWSNRYAITMPHHQDSSPSLAVYFWKPLAILDDGKIIMSMRVVNTRINMLDDMFLRIYDPRTQTFLDGTTVPTCDHVTLFTWSLLHTGQGCDMAARLAEIRRRHG